MLSYWVKLIAKLLNIGNLSNLLFYSFLIRKSYLSLIICPVMSTKENILYEMTLTDKLLCIYQVL